MVAIIETNKSERPKRLDDRDWDSLLKQISRGKCTPIIGTGACDGLYPLKGERAQTWATDEDYPLESCNELARVAEFLAVRDYQAKPIERLVEEFETVTGPDYSNKNELHAVLASLPLPVYITTNYDNFMFKAFSKRAMPRDAKREYCRWRVGMDITSTIFSGEYEPSVANPAVFHLYGQIENENSLVLTVNDYLQFLVNVSRQEKLIPPVIQAAISSASLLFLGYNLDEWDFRILFHSLQTYLRNTNKAHVCVQVVPMVRPSNSEQLEKATKYLNSYFQKEIYNTRVYWGSCHEFVEELRERWEASSYAK